MNQDDSERITHQLNRTATSGPSRWKRVAPLVDRELRKLAAATLRQFSAVNWRPTLQPEELVNEFYVRLLRADARPWENRKHFFAYASASMRSILIDRHRASKVAKRPAAGDRRALDDLRMSQEPASNPQVQTVEIDQALQRLQELSVRQAQIIELRFFGGLEITEIAARLELSEKTVQREWIAARAFLFAELGGLR